MRVRRIFPRILIKKWHHKHFMEDLGAIANSVLRRSRGRKPHQETAVFSYLDECLAHRELPGEVTAVITLGDGNINCYRRSDHPFPDEDSIATLLNTYPIHGQRITGSITHREMGRLTSYRSGYFVPGEQFGVDGWIALVNIPIADNDMQAVKYP